MSNPSTCEHLNFMTFVNIARMSSVEGGPIDRFSADIRIVCEDCKLPFRFIGLPAGVDLNGAATSVDAEEARLAIAPKGKVISVLEGGVSGFSVRNETPGPTRAALLADFALLIDDEYAPNDSDFATKEGWQVHTTIAELQDRVITEMNNAQQAIAQEREACAKVAERWSLDLEVAPSDGPEIAAAIRKRGA